MSKQNQTVATIRFKTSRTYLQNLFPNSSFSFTSPGTVAQASIVCCSLRNMKWLGDTGYDHCGLYIHGVKYTKKDGEVLNGTFLPILFESLSDPIITGREELGAPKWGCNIDISTCGDSRSVRMSWRDTNFAEFEWSGLDSSEAHTSIAKPEPDNGLFMYRYVAAVGEPGKADAEYAVFDEYEKKETCSTEGANRSQKAKSASIKFSPGDWNTLPTLHHIAQGLADVPIHEMLEATVTEVSSVGDVRGARRIE
jgi:hypothetical protein